MIDFEKLAIAMCLAAGREPFVTHNGYDMTWKLYWSEAVRVSNLYNGLWPTETQVLRNPYPETVATPLQSSYEFMNIVPSDASWKEKP